MATLTLRDGSQHELTPPTWYALQHMSDNGLDLFAEEGIDLGVAHVPTILAALLSDSEPLNASGEPSRVWTPTAVMKQLDPGAMFTLLEVVHDLITEALPDDEPSGGASRPTEGQAQGEKP